MNLDNKKVLVMGLGISGISTIKTLSSLKAEVFVYDDKDKMELKDELKDLALNMCL